MVSKPSRSERFRRLFRRYGWLIAAGAFVCAAFPGKASADTILITADNGFELYVDGVLVGTGNDWGKIYSFTVTMDGTSVIAVRGIDSGFVAGMTAHITLSNGKVITTGTNWRSTSSTFSGWQNKTYNDNSWGNPSIITYNWDGLFAGPGAEWIWPTSFASNPAYFRRHVAFKMANDNYSAAPVPASGGTTAASVLSNDRLNMVTATAALVNLSLTATGGLTGATINSAGRLVVPIGSTPGTYTITYRACEAAYPTLCATATATVTVSYAISAANDNFTATPVAGGDATPTVFTNDTLNGIAFAPAAVTASITADGGLTGAIINSDGTITVPAAAAVGTYSLTYRICAVASPATCSTATAALSVPFPSLSVTKAASAPGFTTGNVSGAPVGTVVTYSYVVTNTGGQILTDIALSDLHNGNGPAPVPGSETLSLDAGTPGNSTDVTPDNGIWSALAPGDAVAFTGTYVVTQQDLDLLQ